MSDCRGAVVYYCQNTNGSIPTASAVFAVSNFRDGDIYRDGDTASVRSKLLHALGDSNLVAGISDTAPNTRPFSRSRRQKTPKIVEHVLDGSESTVSGWREVDEIP